PDSIQSRLCGPCCRCPCARSTSRSRRKRRCQHGVTEPEGRASHHLSGGVPRPAGGDQGRRPDAVAADIAIQERKGPSRLCGKWPFLSRLQPTPCLVRSHIRDECADRRAPGTATSLSVPLSRSTTADLRHRLRAFVSIHHSSASTPVVMTRRALKALNG